MKHRPLSLFVLVMLAACGGGQETDKTADSSEIASINPEVAIVTNAPTEDYDSTGLQGWIVTLAWDQPDFSADFTAFAICAAGVRGSIGR